MFDNMGGLKINENVQVINVKDAAISRLHVARNVAPVIFHMVNRLIIVHNVMTTVVNA